MFYDRSVMLLQAGNTVVMDRKHTAYIVCASDKIEHIAIEARLVDDHIDSAVDNELFQELDVRSTSNRC